MLKAPIPKDEEKRIKAVKALGILDTPPEESFDRLTRLATQFFKVPISTITIVNSNREWFKSCQGLPAREGERAISFCGHAMLADDVFLIPDALKDDRFKDNPMVVGEPHIRFYAGVALFDASGNRVGTFCIKDRKPRTMSKEEMRTLKDMALLVELELNAHHLSMALEARKKTEVELKASEKKYRERNEECERLNKIMVGRELKMRELKDEIEELKRRVAPPKPNT